MLGLRCLLVFPSFVMAYGTAGSRSQQAVMARDVSCDTADHGTLMQPLASAGTVATATASAKPVQPRIASCQDSP
jgi:hypothetical protein